jgi:hypothetical protein
VVTVGAKLDETRGFGQGFDFLRVALAMLVVFNHSFLIVEGSYTTVDKYKLWAAERRRSPKVPGRRDGEVPKMV